MTDWSTRSGQLHQAHLGFLAEVQRLSPAQRLKPLAPDDWSPHAVVAHLIGWDEAFADWLELVIAGTPDLFTPPTDMDAFNTASVARRQHLAWGTLLAGMTETEARLQSLIPQAATTGLPIDGGFGRWLEGRREDYEHHRDQLSSHFPQPLLP